MDDQQHYLGCFTKSEGKTSTIVDSICLGSGRFLRSVLIPSLNGGNLHPVVFQTRGRTFLDYCHNSTNTPNDDDDADTVAITYEVDTVNYDGSAETDSIPIYGVGTLGTALGKKAAIDLLQHQMTNIRVIGVGVTEAGLSSCDSQAMIDLTDILRTCYEGIIISKTLKCDNPNGRICLINTDNVSLNGDVIRGHVLEIAKRVQQLQQDEQQIQEEEGTISFVDFLEKGGGVAFHNTMVDRITAQREGSNGMVPRCEPVPSKALVIEDLDSDLPPLMSTDEMREKFGVVVRSQKNQLDADIALKLRVANGTHTAAAHTMALSSLPLTDCLSSSSSPGGSLIMQYLDALFSSQILAGAAEEYGSEETQAVYDDWRRRLCHPHFGLSSFFITQNGAAKGGIRLAPTLRSLAMQNKPINVTMAFAVAAIIRFLTPSPSKVSRPTTHGVYRGWLDGANKESSSSDSDASVTAYADGMHFDLKQGWYEFKTSCLVQTISRNNVAHRKNDSLVVLADALALFEHPQQPTMYVDITRAYLTSGEGGMMQDVSDDILDTFARAVAILYARMVSGDTCLEILQEMAYKANGGIYQHDGLQTDCIALIDGDLAKVK